MLGEVKYILKDYEGSADAYKTSSEVCLYLFLKNIPIFVLPSDLHITFCQHFISIMPVNNEYQFCRKETGKTTIKDPFELCTINILYCIELFGLSIKATLVGNILV